MEKFNKTNKFLIIISMFFTFFLLTMNVSAATTGIVRTNSGYGMLLRSSMSTSASSLGDVSEAATVTILNTYPSGNGCNDNWYQVSYNGKTGYLCSTYVVTEDNTTAEIDPNGEFEQTLNAAGFPESYWPYLKALHEKYPNWGFEALQISTTFDRMVEEQYTLGKNLIQTTNDGWKRVDTYLYDENRFRTDFSGGGSTWYAPSEEIIRYYLDPRNFLNEYDIFMFEKLSFNSTYHTLSGTSTLLSQTFMNGNTIDGENESYATIIMDTATSTQTSPYFIGARIIQEIGTSRSSAVSGTVEGYEGYYNFYNIDATGSSDSMTNVKNGLKRAVTEGWNTERKAITGGAQIISKNYINVGQDTLYNQKFDMTAFWHQYQQNLEAPLYEGKKMRNIYRNNGFMSSSFVFKIPVYSGDMGTNSRPNEGSPINALKELKVNGTSVDSFDRDKKEYTVYVNSSTANITATPHVSSASVSGTGSFNLTDEVTSKTITVTAENGSVNTYKVNLVKSESGETEPTVLEIMPNIGVKYNDTTISGITIGTNVSSLINNVKKQNANASVVIKDCNGKEVTNTKFGTGYTVTITSGGTTKTYTTVIYGDANGDGEITILDLLRVQKIILNTANLSGAYRTAADVNKDGSVTILDLLKVQKDILGDSKITQ